MGEVSASGAEGEDRMAAQLVLWMHQEDKDLQVPVLPAWNRENLESTAEGRVAEAPDVCEAASRDVRKMPCGLCKISSVNQDVFTAWNNV